MSDGISNEQIFGVLLDLKNETGAQTAELKSLKEWMVKHAAEDTQMAVDISNIKLTFARQQGAAKVLTVTGTVAASLVGAVVAWLTKSHQ